MSSSYLYVARKALQFAFQLTAADCGGRGEGRKAKRGSQKLVGYWAAGAGLKDYDRAYALFATVSFFWTDCAPVLWLAA